MTARGTSASFEADGFGRSEVGDANGGARVVNGGGETCDLVRAVLTISLSLSMNTDQKRKWLSKEQPCSDTMTKCWGKKFLIEYSQV